MPSNMGTIDRAARFAIGLALIAYAIPVGFPSTGWNWVSRIGAISLLTAAFGFLPALYNAGRIEMPGEAR